MWRRFEAEARRAKSLDDHLDATTLMLRQCRLNEMAITALRDGDRWLALHLLGQPPGRLQWSPTTDPNGLNIGHTPSGGCLIINRAGPDRGYDGYVIAAMAVHHVPLREHKNAETLRDQAESLAGLVEIISSNMEKLRS